MENYVVTQFFLLELLSANFYLNNYSNKRIDALYSNDFLVHLKGIRNKKQVNEKQ